MSKTREIKHGATRNVMIKRGEKEYATAGYKWCYIQQEPRTEGPNKRNASNNDW